MGRRGPLPKPTAVRELQGNPARRPLPKREARPIAKLPSAPSFLDADGKREWRRLGPELKALGLITNADRSMFALYCHAYARWVQAVRQVLKLQKQKKTNAAHLATWFGVERKAGESVAKYAAHFGMSPATRAQVVQAEREQEESELEAYRRKKRARAR